MESLEAKETPVEEQPRGKFDSDAWTPWIKRALKSFNQKARRTLKKIENGK